MLGERGIPALAGRNGAAAREHAKERQDACVLREWPCSSRVAVLPLVPMAPRPRCVRGEGGGRVEWPRAAGTRRAGSWRARRPALGFVAGTVSSRVRGLPCVRVVSAPLLWTCLRARWRAAGPTLSCGRRCVVGCSDLLVRVNCVLQCLCLPRTVAASWFVSVALCLFCGCGACPRCLGVRCRQRRWRAHAWPVRTASRVVHTHAQTHHVGGGCAREHTHPCAHRTAAPTAQRAAPCAGGRGRARGRALVLASVCFPLYLALDSS